MRLRYFVLITVLVLAALMPRPQVGQAQDGDVYEQLVRRALSELGTSCANLGANSACYGYALVQATFSDGTAAGAFGTPGDRAELTALQSVTTSGLNLADSQWGVAVMNVQANVPSALDQSAVYTLLGDVSMTNEVAPSAALVPADPVAVNTVSQADILNGPGADAYRRGTVGAGTALQADGVSPDGLWVRVMYESRAAWVSRAALDAAPGLDGLPVITKDSMTPMQAFTFATGGDAPPSLAVPPSVVIVQSPKDTPVEIVANGAHIRVGSVIFLRTLPDGRMQIIVGDGAATIFPGQSNELRLVAGTSVILPNAETWTDWRILSQNEWETFGSVEFIPGNVLTYTIQLPDVITPSGIAPQEIIVVVPGEPQIIPVPPTEGNFPIFTMDYGAIGDELERLEWVPFSVGCAVCNPDQVFYHSNSDGDWDVYRLVAGGASLPGNNVSQGDGSQDLQPSYSADGEWVAFVTNRDILGGWEIYVAKPDGTQPARLTFNSGNDVNPVWGPANLIAWESNRDGNWEIYMADVSGDGLPVRLTDDPANDINPFWLPDGGCGQPEGGRIVFQSDRDGEWELYMMDVYTGEVTQLTDNSVEDQVPVLSRDGGSLAWVQQNEFGVYDLWVMDMGTMESRKMAELGADVAGHTFSPDGSLVAFHSDAQGDFDVYAVDLASGQLKVVTDNDAEDRAPSFSCESSVVYYHSDVATRLENPGQRQIFQVNPLPIDGPANFSTRMTEDLSADAVYPLADPHDEINSKEGRTPAHP